MDKMTALEIPSLHPHGKGYRIVFEKPGSSPEFQKLPKEMLKRFEELYSKVQEDPKKHIEGLKQLFTERPAVPEVANLLAYAYLRLRQNREAEDLVEKIWREHPGHLIARINYADQAIRLGKKELILEIFNGCFDLNDLYPERDSFHYSEFRGFMTVMGFYHLETQEKDKAEECYLLAFQVDPLHPSVAALEKKLSKSPLLKKCFAKLQKLARISKNP